MIKGKKIGEWGGGEPGQARCPFHRSLVRVGEPQVLLSLTVVFYICCVRVFFVSVEFYVRSVLSQGGVLTGQETYRYSLVISGYIRLSISLIIHLITNYGGTG